MTEKKPCERPGGNSSGLEPKPTTPKWDAMDVDGVGKGKGDKGKGKGKGLEDPKGKGKAKGKGKERGRAKTKDRNSPKRPRRSVICAKARTTLLPNASTNP